jgi:hypothetical protein
VPSILWACPAIEAFSVWCMLQDQVHHTVHTIPCCISSSTDRYPELGHRFSFILKILRTFSRKSYWLLHIHVYRNWIAVTFWLNEFQQ